MKTYYDKFLDELGDKPKYTTQQQLLCMFLEWLENQGMIDWSGNQKRAIINQPAVNAERG